MNQENGKKLKYDEKTNYLDWNCGRICLIEAHSILL